MSSKGGYTAAPPRHGGGDRFYNPPMVRRHHHQVLQQQLMQRQLLQQQQQQHHQQQQQQQQLQKRAAPPAVKAESSSAAEKGKQKEADDSSKAVALPPPQSVTPTPSKEITNFDRFMDSVTPFIQAQFLKEVGPITGTSEVESRPFYYLEDLWEAFSEWSVYGAGVPILLNGKDPVEQYYVPFLSGIQLYTDPSGPSSRLRLKSSAGPAGADVANLPRQPLFQYFEHELPFSRRPLTDMISQLTSQNPELGKFRSCDLLPTSWLSVAWYPIYRIPVGPTLQDLDASFLTFHLLSTQSSSSCPAPPLHPANTRIVRGRVDPYARISLPVFALTTYKLKGSMLNPCRPHECEQENSLLQAADNWLRSLKVMLPDHQFFRWGFQVPRR